MLHLSALLALLAATSTQSLPLNINLGAYSPALVVGDGEISFGGEADVSNLMTALSGASQGTEAAAAGAGITRAGIEGTVAEKVRLSLHLRYHQRSQLQRQVQPLPVPRSSKVKALVEMSLSLVNLKPTLILCL